MEIIITRSKLTFLLAFVIISIATLLAPSAVYAQDPGCRDAYPLCDVGGQKCYIGCGCPSSPGCINQYGDFNGDGQADCSVGTQCGCETPPINGSCANNTCGNTNSNQCSSGWCPGNNEACKQSGNACECVGPEISPPPSITPPPVGDARPRYGDGLLVPQYPFPCDRVAPKNSVFKDDEFHSLRPYQKSPCNPYKQDLALFCGNDLIVNDSFTINKEFDFVSGENGFQYFGDEYTYVNNPITPNPPWEDEEPFMPCKYCSSGGQCVSNPDKFCIPDFNQCELSDDCNFCTQNPETGFESCSFTVSNSRYIEVDLQGARFPIMGYTEPSAGAVSSGIPKVINSQFSGPETLDDPAKVNEYVSWYLQGINEKAEYGLYDVYKNCISDNNRAGRCEKSSNTGAFGCWDPFYYFDGKGTCSQESYYCCVLKTDYFSQTEMLDRDKLINFSGPLKKLLPIRLQNEARETQTDNAYWSRYLSNDCSACYGETSGDYPVACSDGITCCTESTSCPPDPEGCTSCADGEAPGYPVTCSSNPTICCTQESECP